MPTVEFAGGRTVSAVPLLNDLGAQGWELAGVIGSQNGLTYRLLLKRRIDDGSPQKGEQQDRKDVSTGRRTAARR
jgi:hypothetical protein